MEKTALNGLISAIFVAALGYFLAPVWHDFSNAMRPIIGGALVDLIRIAILISIFAFGFAMLHYFGVLGAGANPVGMRERGDYDCLRKRIAAGNWIEREYARKLKVFLDGVDRFFGDTGKANWVLSAILGLRKAAPLWTAPALDRCLVLALVYPIATIILIWAISNHVGPAEAALGLKATDGWHRALSLVLIVFIVFSTLRAFRAAGFQLFAWLAVATFFSLVIAFALGFGGAVAIAGFATLLFLTSVVSPGGGAAALTVIAASDIVLIFSFNVTTIAGFTTNGFFAYFVGVFVIDISTVLAIVFFVKFVSGKSIERDKQEVFLFLFLPVMFLVYFGTAGFLSHVAGWKIFVGPLLLFLGLLTLLNAPFDWLSLGLTRALMRRGLERERWWPYLYALIDALLASTIIALLAMTMVVGTQLFDDLAIYGGGQRVLPPMRRFLDAIKAAPASPEYWWVYATLFSTILPSLINLFIAGVSLARGIPGLSSWLLGKLKEGEAVPTYDRLLVALVLTLQGVAGVFIAIVAQGFLFWVIIWQGMPRLGIGVLDLAYLVAH